MSELRLQELADTLATSGTTLHVIVPLGVAVGPFGQLAERSGGSASVVAETVTGSDMVTSAIVNRYRIVTTVGEGGSHEVGLDIEGRRVSVTFDVSAATPSTTRAPSTTTTNSAPRSSSAGTTEEQSTTSLATSASSESTAPALSRTRPDATSSGSGSGPFAVLSIALMAAVASAAVVLALRRWPPSTAGLRQRIASLSARRRSATTVAEPLRRPAPPIAEPPRRTARVLIPQGAVGFVEFSAGVGNKGSDWLVSGSLRMCPATGEVLNGRHPVHLAA